MFEDKEENCHKRVDCDALTRDSWRRSIVNVVELLEPDAILDQFLEAGLFGETTRIIVRDIREAGTTSAKNRAIYDRVSRDPRCYAFIKESLVRTRQMGLLDLLEEAEAFVHEKMIGEGSACLCTSARSCKLLESLHCRRDLSEFVPNKLKEIQRKLIKIYEDNCLTAPVFALIPNVRENIDRLYVEPTMQIVDNMGKRLGLDSQACRKTSRKDLTVKSYKDIFYKGNKPCKNIYITGEAGIGKSAFCESLVHTWCHAHTRLKDETGEVFEKEQIMKTYPLLFYISLRYASDDIDIEQMIEHQLGVDNARELLEKENCLVVLDGLDEWTAHEKATGSRFTTKGLPKRSLKGNYTIITTSRPWKLENLRLDESEIDKQINISELTTSSVKDLTGHILAILNNTHCTQKQKEDFLSSIVGMKLHDQLFTPVILSLVVCLWYYGISFGDSECELFSNMIDKQIELAGVVKGITFTASSEGTSEEDPNDRKLPGCFAATENCIKHKRSLLSLSKLAFNMLFHGDRESSLVFDHKATEICGMHPSELDMCLKIGFLTQHKVFVNFIKKTKTISFIHKTHQEYFAALYLATLDQESAYSLLLSNVDRSLDTFLEISKVIVFLNGMNGKLGNDVLSHVRELACEDKRVVDYRLSCIGPADKNYPLVHRVQNLIIDCQHESKKNGIVSGSQQIDDLVLSDSNSLCHLMECWKVLRPRNAWSVSLFVMILATSDEIDDIERKWRIVLDCASVSKYLQKLYIAGGNKVFKIENVFKTVQFTCSTLRCLVLVAIDLSSLGERLRDMLTITRLHTLGLGDNLYLTHGQIDIVSEFLRTANYIEELRLKMFHCLTHTEGDTACKILFDMSGNTALRKLFVMGHIDNILLNLTNITFLEATVLKNEGIMKELLECLKVSKNVTELALHSKFMSDISAIVKLLPAFEGLRKLRLLAMDLKDLPLVLPTTMVQLEHVLISDIRINNSSLRHMIDNLPAQRVEIWMENISINQDDDTQFVKDYIRTSDKFEVTLDDPKWMYFHSVCV